MIFNAKFIRSNAKFIIFNAKFIILNTHLPTAQCDDRDSSRKSDRRPSGRGCHKKSLFSREESSFSTEESSFSTEGSSFVLYIKPHRLEPPPAFIG